MKSLILFLAISCFVITANAQQASGKMSVPDSTKKIMVVEASCGECNFKMEGKGCDLAIRINGKPYFVDGTAIDEHGDAHAKDGFCNAIRKAKVQGKVVKDRFVATYFVLVPEKEKQ